jgi:[FeFe] hydrogenase H-cluster maturation GTPase HydF
LINALTGHNTALVSDVAGTTTDPVYKTIEIVGIGPCVLIDTAGFDDSGYLGNMRVEKTKIAMEKADIAIIVCSEEDIAQELLWARDFKERHTPVVMVINKIDQISNTDKIRNKVFDALKEEPIKISAISKIGIEKIREEIIRKLPEDFDSKSITGDLVKENDLVLLVMPQDIQAPKGRLILPQMQTLRELLDKKCIIVSCTADKYEEALTSMGKPPKLIITDSQVFQMVYDKKPEESLLTSFSVLFASNKGDIDYFVKSAAVLDTLTEKSKVLIAEACTHVPQTEDIGRVKIPRWLTQYVGGKLEFTHYAGHDFPADIADYKLIMHCGACMTNRREILSRIMKAKQAGVPITNYGLTIAYSLGIFERALEPFPLAKEVFEESRA